ncbi:MAG TPA: hypothetical protein VNU92_05240 [Edaphobacter sp.]|jgi:hypothetical protein|nr:hypothetical protein [Edaphobacter sp.]
MADVTPEVQVALDNAIDQVSRTPTQACVAGFTAIGAVFGASSALADFGLTGIPGFVAGGAVGLALGNIICKIVTPLETQIRGFQVGQAQTPPIHIVGLPSNLSVAQNISPSDFVEELRRIRATIRVQTT